MWVPVSVSSRSVEGVMVCGGVTGMITVVAFNLIEVVDFVLGTNIPWSFIYTRSLASRRARCRTNPITVEIDMYVIE